jgi:hypothetical protein
MNIELDEVVGLDVSDDALELAAGRALGAEPTWATRCFCFVELAGLWG